MLKMSKFTADGHMTKYDFLNYELPLSKDKFCT